MKTVNRECENCKTVTYWILSRKITRSGADFYGWRCQTCKRWVRNKIGGMWIKKEELLQQGINLEELPVGEYDAGERCACCGERGAELHHWAPRAIFGPEEAERWPKDYLCKTCHDRWHLKVTPQLVKTTELTAKL